MRITILFFVACAILATNLVRGYGREAVLWALGGLLVVAIPVAIYAYMLGRNLSLCVTDRAVGWTDWLARYHEVPISDLAELRLASLASPGLVLRPLLLGISHDGRCVLSVDGAGRFSKADIELFASTAGLPLAGSWEDRIDANQPDTFPPEMLRPLARFNIALMVHPSSPWLIGFIVTGIVIAVIILWHLY
jgi:hypothetical protein